MQAYSNNLVDHHLILDLLPFLARAYFARRLPAPMSYGQAAILVSLGLQQQDVSECEKALNLPASQVLALFNKVCLPQDRLLWQEDRCLESSWTLPTSHMGSAVSGRVAVWLPAAPGRERR